MSAQLPSLATRERRPSLEPRRPRLLGAFDRVAAALGVFARPLSPAEMVDLAQRQTGLADFGNEPFREPLQVLARSYEDEACLSTFGRIAARWDAVRFLSNLLMLRRAETEDPAILGQPIEQPIFITGMPRSGTTFLHNLLAQNSSSLVVRCWETIYPYPSRTSAPGARDRRPEKVERHLNGFARLAPGVRQLHPITARSPQECTEINGHVFRSLRFDTTHEVPTYRRWLDETGHLAAYRFHRRFLQHMQHQKGPGRWILKSPDHVFALDALREVYPDAFFIFMHRNPSEVLPSAVRLTEVLRRPFTRAIDRHELGRQVTEHLARGAAILIGQAESRDPRVAHIDYRTLVRDPLGTLAVLHDRFGLTFGDGLAERLRGSVAQWPQKGNGHDDVVLEEYGLSAEAERRRYRDYTACFGL